MISENQINIYSGKTFQIDLKTNVCVFGYSFTEDGPLLFAVYVGPIAFSWWRRPVTKEDLQ